MTFDDIWRSLCDNHDGLDSTLGKVEIRSTELRKLLRKAYDAGVKEGEKRDTAGLFDRMFGGGKR
jgi:hypothetical protein